MPSILSRYIFKELITPFAVSISFLTFIFLMTRIPEITNMVVNYNTGIASLVMLLIYTIPRFMELTIPLSVMIAVLLTVMRMSNDNEITALKGSGISLSRLVYPVMVFSALATALSLSISIWGVPWGRFSFAVTGAELAKSTFQVALKERQFNNTFDGVMIYVTSIDVKSSEFSDIFIEDSRNPDSINITVASKGILVADDAQSSYTFRLSDGTINQVDIEDRSVNAVNFDIYDINFDTQFTQKSKQTLGKDYDEMYLYELIHFIKKEKGEPKEIRSARMELHQKFAIPFSCLALGLLALPLGISSGPSSKRSSGFGLALSFSLLYYLLLAGAKSVGETSSFSPVIGIWIPDIVMFIAAIYLFSRAASEKPFIKRYTKKITL